MPSMFSRRRASSATRPLDPQVTSSATLAASQAFGMPRKPSTTSLSSAAAAAALRSHTTSPEPIGNIQTKRMIRRGSTSSAGSGNGGLRPGLQRNNSNGSMSERTFRSPSPARSNGGTESAAVRTDVPPVPAIPAHMAHQRSASMEPAPRVTSPTPQGRGKGAGAQRLSMPPPSNKQSAQSSDGPETPSRNFSRPMSPSPGTPVSPTGTSAQYTHSSGSWHPGPSGQALAAKNGVRSASTEPPSKVDRILRSSQPLIPTSLRGNRITSGQGSHFTSTSPNPGRPQSAMSSRSTDPVMVYDPNSRSFVPQQAAAARGQAWSASKAMPGKADAGVWDPNTRRFVPRQTSNMRSATASTTSSASTPNMRSATASPIPSVSASDLRSATVSPPPPAASRSTAPPKPVVAPIDTGASQDEPPPRNPARLSPVAASPVVARTEALHRQPSVVHEDAEAEQEAEGLTTVLSNTSDASTSVRRAALPRYTLPGSKRHDRSTSLDLPPPTDDAAERGRNLSVSPQRSAHFSSRPIVVNTIHEPPRRNISPAKSALKQPSPASSVRGNSPIGSAVKSPPSEVSDSVSDVGSQDGSVRRKKKSVRVSFDEQASAIALAAARPLTPTSDEEDFMKPRPSLPSFGSVRKARMQPEPAEKVTEMHPERQAASSDHAIGGILKNRDAQAKMEEPLPPEVTSKESAGYISDSASEADVPVAIAPATASAPVAVAAAMALAPNSTDAKVAAAQAEPEDVHVPAINLLPPSPGLDDASRRRLGDFGTAAEDSPQPLRSSMEGIVIPGGWSGDDDSEEQSTSVPIVETSQPPPQAFATQPLTTRYELHPVDESEDEGEFSDAAEDLSDLDDGGFASLDAIMQRPMVTDSQPKTAVEAASIAAALDPSIAGSKEVAGGDEQTNGDGGDWRKATAYWSKLSKQQRDQIEMAHLQSDDETRESTVVAVKQPTKKRSQPTIKTSAAPRPNSSAQPVKSAMKKSMRGPVGPPSPTSDNEGVHLRQSMRGGPAQAQRDSRQMPRTMRPTSEIVSSTTGAAVLAATQRPKSAVIDQSQAPASPATKASRTTQARPVSQQPPPQVSNRLTKELAVADGSDSDTSFRRRRRAGSNSTSDSRYSMKRSMRGGPAEPVPPMPAMSSRRPTSPTPSRGGSSLLRSLSPSGSLFGRSRGDKLKESLRDGSVDGGRRTTLRGTPPGRPQPAAPATKSRFKSRFADSDDEEDDVPTRSIMRSSRFIDSDDDEPTSPTLMRNDLTPVRGIPRRAGRNDGDSTDLEDSDDQAARKGLVKRAKQSKTPGIDPAEVEKAMAAARRNLGLEATASAAAPTALQEGEALQKGTLRAPAARPPLHPPGDQGSSVSPSPRRRSFMGSILRRNRNSTMSIPQDQISTPPPGSPTVARPPLPPSSPSQQRNKLVRRGSQQPRGDGTPTASMPTSPAPRAEPESWPLPPPIPADDPVAGNERPSTSDGVSSAKMARTMRPELQPRSASTQPAGTAASGGPRVRIMAGQEGSEPGERASDKSGAYGKAGTKKKRFGMFRRAFNLDA